MAPLGRFSKLTVYLFGSTAFDPSAMGAAVREQIRRQVESAIIAFEEAVSFAERVRHCKSAYHVEKEHVLPVSVRKSVKWLQAIGTDW
uniref:Uncharacterized protein n=1 Tax=Daphnia galeata TaxID=27404 RepID=A0A8J2WCE9_9CRUS|nr:unnamed protein product [Daphnia galeata]